MGRFLLQRLTLVIPVLLGVIFVTFVLVRSIPGDPCLIMLVTGLCLCGVRCVPRPLRAER